MPKQDLKTATRKAVQNSRLDALDNFGSNQNSLITEDDLTEIDKTIGEFIKKVQENIQKEDMIVSGAIDDITVEHDGTDINIIAPSHLSFQDKGVNGSKVKLYDTPYSYKDTKPPIEPFKDWVKAKGIEDESAAYAIREKVFQEGIKPRNIYSKKIPSLIEALSSQITGFTSKHIVEVLTNKR